MTETQNSTKSIASSWEKHGLKKPLQCSYCRMRTGHNVRNSPKKTAALVSQQTSSQFPTLGSAYNPASPIARSTLPSPISKVASIGNVEFVSEKQATPISLPKSAFWPLINIAEMVTDGNYGFRAVAHTILFGANWRPRPTGDGPGQL